MKGFTFVETILYVAIVSLMLTSLIPFAWDIILGGSKSAVQQEVSSNARIISERVKYEIRNSFGINSLSGTQIVLCKNSSSCATNPTTIAFSSSNITIESNGASAVNLNSNDVVISAVTFTNNTSSDNKTKNISFVFTVSQTGSARSEFQSSMTAQSSVEVRSN